MEACMALMLWASAFTGLPMVEECPDVYYESPKVLDDLVGAIQTEPNHCYPWAVYITRGQNNGMVLRRTWYNAIRGSMWREAVVVHELVHHLQYRYMGHGPTSKKMLTVQEKQAYETQLAYIRGKGQRVERYKPIIHCGTPYPVTVPRPTQGRFFVQAND